MTKEQKLNELLQAFRLYAHDEFGENLSDYMIQKFLVKVMHEEYQSRPRTGRRVDDAIKAAAIVAEKLIPKCKQCAGTGRVIDDDFTKETIPCESCNNEIDKAVEESISMIKNFTNGYTQCIEDLRNWNGGIDTPLHLDLHNKLITMENSMRERASNLLQ